MHGEYKVPGGKLVVADLEVTADRISHATVSGDFFLEPDDALPIINQALIGQPTSAPATELRDAIDAALTAAATRADGLSAPAQMMGFTTRDVAIAVRRALGHSTGWDAHNIEVLHPGPLTPATHAALDQVLAEELVAGRRGPTLRFWEWEDPAVVIGSFQSLRNEVDLAGAERHGVTVVRRISGGGAMFMEAGNCITFSLVVPASLVDSMSFEDSYAFLDEWVIGALADVGVQAHYAGLNDIASPAGKIAGAAQKRLAGGAVLHHVTMAYDIDADKMLEVLRIGREKMSDKGTKSANKRVDPVRSQTDMTREDVIKVFKAHFENRYRTQRSELRPEELSRAEQLVAEKFANPEWTARVP